MSHFLGRLVDRARGTALRIEPVIHSRFAPAFQSDVPAANDSHEIRSQHTLVPAEPASGAESRATQSRPALAPSEITIEKQSEVAPTEQILPSSEIAIEEGPAKRQSQPTPAPLENKPTPERDTSTKKEVVATSGQPSETPIEIVRESLLVPQVPKRDQAVVVRQAPTTQEVKPAEARASHQGEDTEPHINHETSQNAQPRALASIRPASPLPPVPVRREQSRDLGTPQNPQPAPRVSTPQVSPLPHEHPDQVPHLEMPRRQQSLPRVSTARLLPVRDDSRDQAPIVRVTIGRIEVRAAPEPPAPVRKPARPAPPALTLDAYLKSRKEGRL